MVWEKIYKIKVHNIDKIQIWRVWEDVNNWHLWDSDIEFAHLTGPFKVGKTFQLKPKAGPKVNISIVKAEPNVAFTDVTTFPLAKMYSIHEMRDTRDGLEISHTIRVEGFLSFLWRKLVVEKVAAGLEEQSQNMIKRARDININGK